MLPLGLGVLRPLSCPWLLPKIPGMERKVGAGLQVSQGSSPCPAPCPHRELPPLLVRKLVALLLWLIVRDCSTLIINRSPPRQPCGLLAGAGLTGHFGGAAGA